MVCSSQPGRFLAAGSQQGCFLVGGRRAELFLLVARSQGLCCWQFAAGELLLLVARGAWPFVAGHDIADAHLRLRGVCFRCVYLFN